MCRTAQRPGGQSRRREGATARTHAVGARRRRAPQGSRRCRTEPATRRRAPRGPAEAAARSRAASATDKAVLAEQRKREKARKARQARVADLETRIAAHETAIKALEAEMSAPGFYEQRDAAQAQLTRHQTLMWEVGELMQQWEMLSETDESDASGDA